MPSGRVHARASVILSVPVFVGSYLLTKDWGYSLTSSVSCILGIFMTPDLDQEGLCTGESLIVKWTLGIGFLWCAIWYPYATMFSHRSFYTHFPIVSTLIRILYLFVPTFIILHLLGYNIHIPWIYALFGFIGLVISDTAHWAMDRF